MFSPTLIILGPSIVPSRTDISIKSTPYIISQSIPNASPTFSNDLQCFSICEYGRTSGNISRDTEISLITENNEQIGNVLFPDIQGSFDITFVTNIDSNLIGNTILDITIFDLEGNSISRLPDSLKICIKQEKRNYDNICLSFFNTETEKWECEDKCLSREGNQYCGTTDHLTSFALLLQGDDNNNGGNCNSSENNYIFAWIYMALIIFAILLVCFCAVLNEIRFVFIRRRKKRIMSLMAGTAECDDELVYNN